MSLVAASYLKPTVNSRSLIIETLTFNSEESYIAYILMTQGRIYKIEKPYETENTKTTTPQTLGIEVKSCTFDCWMSETDNCLGELGWIIELAEAATLGCLFGCFYWKLSMWTIYVGLCSWLP